MRAEKPVLSHALRVIADSMRQRYGSDVKLELHADKSVRITGGDMFKIEVQPKTIEDFVNEIVPPVTKQEKLADISAIYAEYPRKRDPEAARRAIAAAINDEEIPVHRGDRVEFLRIAARLYAKWCAVNRKEQEWIPYPQTWFRRKSYLNATKVVLDLMEQIKSGVKQPVVKRKEFPLLWDSNQPPTQ